MSIRIAVQKEINPGLKILLVRHGLCVGYPSGWLMRKVRDVAIRNCCWYIKLLLTRSSQWIILPGSKLQILLALIILILQFLILIFETLNVVLLLECANLALEAIIDLYVFHAAEADEQHDDDEYDLPNET